MGFHTHFSFAVGNYAANAIAIYGAKFIGTNPDPARPVEGGEIEAGTGAILSFIETASHTKPLLMGKPYPEMYQMALQRMNLSLSDALMIGDLLITDIKGAVDIGMDSALVLTGMTTRDDVEKSPVKPTYLVETLEELIVDD